MNRQQECLDAVEALNNMAPNEYYFAFTYTTDGYRHYIQFMDEYLYTSENDTLCYYDWMAEEEKEYTVLEYCLKTFKEWQKRMAGIKLKKPKKK